MSTDIKELGRDQSMIVTEYTSGVEIYDLKEMFFSLLAQLNLGVIARKDDYGNVSFHVERTADYVAPEQQTIDQLDAKAIREAIVKAKGDLTRAALVLGIGRATLYRKIKQYNIDL